MDDLVETNHGCARRKERNEKWMKEVQTSRKERNEPWMTEPKGKTRKLDDPAERKETKNGRPSRKEK